MSILLLLLSICILARQSKEPFVFRIMVVGFLARIIIMILDCYGIVGIPGNGDEEQFHLTALENQFSSEPFYITNYTVFLTYFYRFSDNSRLLAQYMNVLMGMMFLVYLDKTLRLINTNIKDRKTILLIATFMPNMIFFAAILLREAWIEMFLMMSIFYYIKWFLSKGKTYHAILSVSFVFFATWMHSGCIMVLIGYILSFFIYNRRTKSIQISNSFIPAFTLSAIAFFILVSNMESFLGKLGGIGDVATEDMMVDLYNVNREAGSRYLDWLDITTPTQAILFAPLKMFYFLFSPIPLDWRSPIDAIAFLLDSCIYIFLFYKIIKNQNDSKERKYLIRFLLVSFFLTTFLFAFGTIASGTAVRHRAKIIAFLFVCYGLTSINSINKLKISPNVTN